MKIITWNINGIRAALGRNALDWAFAQQPDVLCLQEVKAHPEQLTDEQHAQLKLPHAWNPAQRAGYSGVTSFYKEQPDEILTGMGMICLTQRAASFKPFKQVAAYLTYIFRMAREATSVWNINLRSIPIY